LGVTQTLVGAQLELKGSCQIGTGRWWVSTKGILGGMGSMGDSRGVDSLGATVGIVAKGDPLESMLPGSFASTTLHQPALPGTGVFENSGLIESVCHRVL